MTTTPKSKGGRPRLSDSRPELDALASEVLPMMQSGDLNWTQAARQLGISVRSLKRYAGKMSDT